MDGFTGAYTAAFKAHHRTDNGEYFISSIEDALSSKHFSKLKGQVQLILTSPPFPLNRKKKYGNRNGEEYVEWLSGLAPQLAELLTEDGYHPWHSRLESSLWL